MATTQRCKKLLARKIGTNMRKRKARGWSRKQAIAVGFAQTRKEGCKMPKKKRKKRKTKRRRKAAPKASPRKRRKKKARRRRKRVTKRGMIRGLAKTIVNLTS